MTGPVRKGDIIQFEQCKFKWTTAHSWGEIDMDHHTAIILEKKGAVLTLIHQNAPIGGPVSKQVLDLSWKTEGSYTIWRPIRW